MLSVGDITSIDSREKFDAAALATFRFQAERCAPYAEYLRLIGVEPRSVGSVDEIPFLPIEIFRSHKVYCGAAEPEKCFTSSSTGGAEPSRHYMERLADYEACFRKAYAMFYGSRPVYALLPCYLEREGSSLVYMADRLIADNGGGFFLDDFDELLYRLNRDKREKVLLGVSYALLDLAERHAPKLRDTIVMETGGMKGRRKELPKDELHRVLGEAFGVEQIHSEYGMAELTSQAYSSGEGIFVAPPWMRVSTRDLNDPFAPLESGKRGGINIIDLGNRSSCAFLQTQDVGVLLPDGRFRLTGRVEDSPIRGCNLLVE